MVDAAPRPRRLPAANLDAVPAFEGGDPVRLAPGGVWVEDLFPQDSTHHGFASLRLGDAARLKMSRTAERFRFEPS